MSERAFLGSAMRPPRRFASYAAFAVFAGALAGCGNTFVSAEADDGSTDALAAVPGNDGSSDAALAQDATRADATPGDAATTDAAEGDAPSQSDARTDANATSDATATEDVAEGSTPVDAPEEAGCTGLPCNGSCVPSDIHNCGVCGNACPPVTNGSPTCSGSVCGVACAAGFTLGCDGKSCIPLPNEGIGVFAGPGGATTGCGSVATPCGTIASALTVAASTGSSVVYLLPGTYSETVVLSSSVTLQGGWAYAGNDKFAPVCSADPASAAIIKGAGGGGVIMAGSASVIVTAGSPTLDTLTVQNEVTAAAGESLYGVFAVNAGTVRLTNVDVQVAAGGNGQPGTQGPPGSTPVSNLCATDTGNPGTNAPPGQGAPLGSWSASGFAPNAGSTGTTGGVGHNGLPGAPGACVSSVQACEGTPPCSLSTLSGQLCAGSGHPGCGGGGGGPGTPGTGAGSSVAVFAWKSQVIGTGTFNSGPGGTGGEGGAPGQPAGGSTGSAGADLSQAATCTTDYCNPQHTAFCCTAKTSTFAAAGGAGTLGGTGGFGSNGGGGSGGNSYCFVSGGGGTVTAAAAVCTPGTPGTGGNVAGTSHGADGSSGVSLALP